MARARVSRQVEQGLWWAEAGEHRSIEARRAEWRSARQSDRGRGAGAGRAGRVSRSNGGQKQGSRGMEGGAEIIGAGGAD